MYDKDLVINVINLTIESCNKIKLRFKPIKTSEDFLKDETGLEKLDSICMQLIAIGESIKNIDKLTNKKLLQKYPEFEWKKAAGMRDIISHHYFDINSEIIFEVCQTEIPRLKNALTFLLNLLETDNNS